MNTNKMKNNNIKNDICDSKKGSLTKRHIGCILDVLSVFLMIMCVWVALIDVSYPIINEEEYLKSIYLPLFIYCSISCIFSIVSMKVFLCKLSKLVFALALIGTGFWMSALLSMWITNALLGGFC